MESPLFLQDITIDTQILPCMSQIFQFFVFLVHLLYNIITVAVLHKISLHNVI